MKAIYLSVIFGLIINFRGQRLCFECLLGNKALFERLIYSSISRSASCSPEFFSPQRFDTCYEKLTTVNGAERGQVAKSVFPWRRCWDDNPAAWRAECGRESADLCVKTGKGKSNEAYSDINNTVQAYARLRNRSSAPVGQPTMKITSVLHKNMF